MLIYNHRKELVGIDESDLNRLGFKNLAELNAEASDFADLFVKKPGFIHNFKHVHWIDFIKAADDGAISKVTIQSKGKRYNANIQINSIYLHDEPSLSGYIIYLQKFCIEGEDIFDEPIAPPPPPPPPQAQKMEVKPIVKERVVEEFVEEIPKVDNSYKTTQLDLNVAEYENDNLDLDLELDAIDDIYKSDIEDDIFKDDLYTKNDEVVEVDLDDKVEIQTTDAYEEDTLDDDIDNNYVYDPHIASDELGLPLDLVEEFIGDFILQAKDFKSELYSALSHNDSETVKNLSHKLKGVAANLRIDDAFEYLAVINTSNDQTEIKHNLNKFYKVISKLAGETPQPQPKPAPKQEIKKDAIEIEDEDMFTLPQESFKKEELKEESVEILNDDIFTEPKDTIKDDANSTTDANDESLDMVYYKQLVANELGLSDEIFNELLSDFVEEARVLSAAIEKAAHDNDQAHCKKEAIKLKGMSENMRLKDFAKDLEKIINTDDKDDILKSVQNINHSLEKISN